MGSSKAMYDSDPKEQIIDIRYYFHIICLFSQFREHDIPFETRVCIDNKLFVGLWYDVTGRDKSTNSPIITKNDQVIEPPDPTVGLLM
jgi:DNA polymerase elongation subunit (family B)